MLADDLFGRITCTLRVPGVRTQSANNLQQLAIALNTYALNNNGRFPAIGGAKDVFKGGPNLHPNLSWRVAILPYMEEENVYNLFHLDEPWDSPHNLTLLPCAIKTFMLPSVADPPGMTRYRAITGKFAAFEPLVPGAALPVGRLLTDFPNGAGQTIFIVEAAEAVPWTKPDELEYLPDLPLPHLQPRCQCVLGDGSVRTIEPSTPENEVRALMERGVGRGWPP